MIFFREIDILVVGAQPSGGEYALKGACQQGQVSFFSPNTLSNIFLIIRRGCKLQSREGKNQKKSGAGHRALDRDDVQVLVQADLFGNGPDNSCLRA